jgi:hypothetical protein
VLPQGEELGSSRVVRGLSAAGGTKHPRFPLPCPPQGLVSFLTEGFPARGMPVPSREFYLQQARSCFDMAATSRDPPVRARWINRANDYLILADAMGDEPMPELPLDHPPQTKPQQPKKQDGES